MVGPTVYTPKTLAQRWQCSERHVRTMIATGELPSFRLGDKLVRIRGEDVRNMESVIQCDQQPFNNKTPAESPNAVFLPPVKQSPLVRVKLARLRGQSVGKSVG